MTIYNKIGKGIVEAEKVRVYHHFWGKLLPAKIPDLYSKMERLRFNYPDILLQGRIWKRRKMMVIDQFYYSNRLSKFVYISEFLEVAEHYVGGIYDFNLIFKESESSNIYMDTINEVYDKCLLGSHQSQKYQL